MLDNFWGAVVAGVMALVGMGFLARGWRGRRVGDHPYCRRCGFDLVGTYPDSATCSECGADLSIPNDAVQIGERKHRAGLMVGGLAIFLPAILLVYAIGMGTLDRVNWQAQKPTWWLTMAAKSSDAETRRSALAELETRIQAGKLTAAQTQSLVDDALRLQSQPDQPSFTGWGDLVVAARSRSAISDQQWERYARQAIEGAFVLHGREKYRPGDRMFLRVENRTGRIGRDHGFRAKGRVEGLMVDGKELPLRPDSNIIELNLMRGGLMNIVLDRGLLDGLGVGAHTGYLRLHAKATDQVAIIPPDELFAPARTQQEAAEMNRRIDAFYISMFETMPTVADAELQLPIRFAIVPESEPVLKRNDDEQFRPDVLESIAVERVIIEQGIPTLKITCNRPAIDLSYAVLLRSGDREWPIGSLKNQSALEGMVPLFALNRRQAGAIPQPLGISVDVVFRPDPSVAADNPAVFEYWGGEIVCKNIPVEEDAKLESPAVTRPVSDAGDSSR